MKKIFTHFVIDYIHFNKSPEKKTRKFDDDLKIIVQLNFVPSEKTVRSIISYSKLVS